jgi:hypothetical protein
MKTIIQLMLIVVLLYLNKISLARH